MLYILLFCLIFRQIDASTKLELPEPKFVLDWAESYKVSGIVVHSKLAKNHWLKNYFEENR